jgi:sugar/nucleoside kinase (ribokinase family)
MGPEVVCLGAVNVDLLFRVEDLGPFLKAFPSLGSGGEVALPQGKEGALKALLARHARFLSRQGGGQAANTGFALARLGAAVALVGRVGADADGAFLLDSLAGVNLDYLRQTGESGRAYILLDQAGERTILVAPNTNDELRQEDLPLELIRAAKFLHLTSFVGDGPLAVQTDLVQRLCGGRGQSSPSRLQSFPKPPPPTLYRGLGGEFEGRTGELRSPGPPLKYPAVSLDPGELYARRGRLALAGLLARVETLLVTEWEWNLLGGEAERHPEWAPPVVLLKRGPQGARLLTREGCADFPAEKVPGVVDTLGAGDVFAAGYLAGRLAGLGLADSVRLAGQAAAVSLAGAGREQYPDREFLRQQLAKLK